MLKSKKIIALLLAVLMVATMMVGCTKDEPKESTPVESTPGESTPVESKDPSEEQKPVVLTLATGSGSDTAGVKHLISDFCDAIYEKSNGKITVECYPDSQLYGTSQLPEAVMTGAIDIMHNGTAGTWPDYCPVFNFTEAWFVWTGREHIMAHLEEYKELLFPLWEEDIGVKPLCLIDAGEGGMLTKTKITGPEDMKGLMMVGPNQPDWDAMTVLGATPVQMASSERYDALAKGAIDGMRLTYTGMTRYSLQDHCDYFVPGTAITMFCLIMNQDSWDALTPWAQDIITEVSLAYEASSFDMQKENEAKNMETLTSACETYYLTQEDILDFQEALQPYYDNLMKACVEDGYQAEAERFLEIAAS